MNSQHSRRHSNDTNSDLSDDEIFLPDETQSGIRRASKTGDILASPTHRKLTPTHIRSAGSSPIKRAGKRNSREFRSLNGSKANDSNFEEIHEHYRSIIADLKQSHEENIKHMKFKLHSLENSPQPDDEYLVSQQHPHSTVARKCLIINIPCHLGLYAEGEMEAIVFTILSLSVTSFELILQFWKHKAIQLLFLFQLFSPRKKEENNDKGQMVQHQVLQNYSFLFYHNLISFLSFLWYLLLGTDWSWFIDSYKCIITIFHYFSVPVRSTRS